MRGAIIYFSGTGNTEFVARQFKRSFEERGEECSLVDTARKKVFKDDYDFLVFGSPIHAEVFPDIFMDWIGANVKDGRNRDAIVFSTQGAESGSGVVQLGELLRNRGFNIKIQYAIEMPNNYYLSGFEKPSVEDIARLKERARSRVEYLVEKFQEGENIIHTVSKTRLFMGRAAYKGFYLYSRNWAGRNLSVDMDVCVRCGKCVKNCPVKNISLQDSITFKDKCISCQKCLHSCPVNAFLYNSRKIEQYKL